MIRPSRNREAWDHIVLAGLPSPGTCVVSGATRAIGWDVKDADGQAGASSSRKGEPIGKFDCTFHLVDDPSETVYGDFEAWDAFHDLCMVSVSEDKPIALEVVHPDLNRLGYTAVVLREMGDMVLDGKGGATVKVGFLEYRPPKPKDTGGVGSTKTGGGSATKKGGGDDGDPFEGLTPEERAQELVNIAKHAEDLVA